jgi:dihydrofolate synthase/folylpolyglutamate synthase
MNTYSQLLARLFSLQTQVKGKLHLETMQKLCEKLGNPQNSFESVHVAGTNGKGSVCSMIAKGLVLSGYKVGLNTSPHIACFRERIRVNGIMISEAEVCEYLPRIFQAIEDLQLTTASFFEITTALAFLYFAEQKVDCAIIETGLGGRLDATNVITPCLSIITSISLEHTEILGSTLDEITHEKAGIIKKHVAVIIGPTVDSNIIASYTDLYFPISGDFKDYKEENRAIALEAMHFLPVRPEHWPQALDALPSCRFEETMLGHRKIIFDVAHNPAGIEKLCQLLEGRYEIIIAISSTKDLERCLEPLIPFAKNWFPVSAQNGRSYNADVLEKQLLKMNVPSEKIHLEASVTEAMQNALTISDLPVLVCGSFFIMAEARLACAIQEPRDNVDLNEKTMPTT